MDHIPGTAQGGGFDPRQAAALLDQRSEERRVGKEC